MNSEQQLSLVRYRVFDPMNAHSQADHAALMYVMQFNTDEREWQEKHFRKFAREQGVNGSDRIDCDLFDVSLRAFKDR